MTKMCATPASQMHPTLTSAAGSGQQTRSAYVSRRVRVLRRRAGSSSVSSLLVLSCAAPLSMTNASLIPNKRPAKNYFRNFSSGLVSTLTRNI